MEKTILSIFLFAIICALSVILGVVSRELGEAQKAHLATYDELIELRTRHIELQEGYLEVGQYYLDCIEK